jgi:endonuclease I
MIKKLLFALALLWPWLLMSQPPVNYYKTAENLSGVQLQEALHHIVKNHKVLSYSALWNAFYSTDATANNKVWDMYSDVPGGTAPYVYTFGSNQCGNYSKEGDCYNREHTFPVSWFNDQSPMNTDLFQIYPTDGFVNQKRGNYPYGETTSATWTSQNGSQVGTSSVAGYSDIIFEPLDEYKGDIARTYFYMATRYYQQDANWPGSPMVNGAQPKTWAMNMLLQWHQNDPVSEKEIARNNAVYALQSNRNPFIDKPEYVSYIWEAHQPPLYVETPTNHVNDFSSSFITLTWNDAQSESQANGYLIFIDDQGFHNIPSPANGTIPTSYANSKAVLYGTQSCTFYELNPNQTYYFKIYSYAGAGLNTIYKTDGIVPQLTITTN